MARWGDAGNPQTSLVWERSPSDGRGDLTYYGMEVEDQEDDSRSLANENQPPHSRPHGCGCCPVKSTTYSLGTREPRDRGHLVYVCMVLVGAGFLFPWFSFITAVDYFLFLYRENFPHVSVAIPITYLLTTLVSSTFNVVIVNKLPIHCRIGYGYVMFFVALLFVVLLDVGINNCTIPTHVSFYLTLLAVVVLGLGSGVQQASYYGLSSMLPRRYTQAVMAGESVAGVIVAVNRIVTKASFPSERTGAITFFCLSLGFIVVCVGCQVYIRASPLVKWHVALCQPPPQSPQNGDIPLESLSDSDASDQEQLIRSVRREESALHKFVVGLRLRTSVVRETWRLIVALTANSFVTLIIFPGLLSEVKYDQLGDWTPILVITIFNIFDLILKWIVLIPLPCSPSALMVGSLLRVLFIPLLLLCISPSPSQPVLHHGVVVWASLIACGLGVTNGYYGSVPLINVSKEVKDPTHRELAGTMLVWFLLGGLTLGSAAAYALTPLTELMAEPSNSSHLIFDLCSNRTA